MNSREWLTYRNEKRTLSKQKENMMKGETVWLGKSVVR